MTGRSLSQVRPLEPLVPLEAVTSTGRIGVAHIRPPQYEAESQVLVELAGQMIRRLPAFWSIWSKRS